MYSCRKHLKARVPMHSDIIRIHPYTSVWWPLFWGSQMYCIDWEKSVNHIALRQHKWLFQQDLHIQVYVLVFYKIYKSCWSSHLRWWRAIRLAPFSQSLQYISDPQNNGHHMEVYKVSGMWCQMHLHCCYSTCLPTSGCSKMGVTTHYSYIFVRTKSLLCIQWMH